MALESGTRLGPYEITAAIGAGGMGEVYRAHDPRLKRDVAIKVLPDDLRQDAKRRERFLREAEAVAGLKHPHICVLHDLGQHEGTDFLVMELLEGETLAKRLQKGALPLKDALRYGAEIADALATAHKAGVVHRDLKPQNVMLTKTGTKLLDFGLAKLKPSLGTGESTTHLEGITTEGVIIGTPQYMAPEQIEGRETDARTDIFAFGAVLYEMLTGKKAFKGKSRSSLIGAILHTDPPPMAATQPSVPRALDHVVRRCLEKAPARRWQSVDDLTGELEWVGEETATGAVSDEVLAASPRTRGTHLAWLAAGVVITGLGLWAIGGRTTQSNQPRQFEVPIAPADVLSGAGYDEAVLGHSRPSRTGLAMSPDGARLVFVGMRDGQQQLFVRELDSRDAARPLDGTEGGETPFISPNGDWVGFWSDGVRGTSTRESPAAPALRKVPIGGGPVVQIVTTQRVAGVSWGDEDVIVFNCSPQDKRLWRVAASGGRPAEVVAMPDEALGITEYDLPHLLPGSRDVIYTYVPFTGVPFTGSADPLDRARVAVLSLETGVSKDLVENATDGRYASTGHLVFMRAGTLMAAPFDVDRQEVTGGEVGVVDDVMQAYYAADADIDTGAGQYAFSEMGDLAYLAGGTILFPQRQVVWFDRTGEPDPLPLAPATYGVPRLSPDGRHVVAMQRTGYARNLLVYDRERNDSVPLLFDDQAWWPLWTEDSQRIVFRFGGEVVSVAADGSDQQPRKLGDGLWGSPAGWGPKGELIFVQLLPPSDQFDIMAWWPEDDTVRPVLETPADERFPALSPDGDWLAYTSDILGHHELYVRPYPSMVGGKQVSIAGALGARWTRDGRELLYREPGTPSRLMAVDMTGLPESVGRPTLVFGGPFGGGEPLVGWDVTPDGQRVLGILRAAVPNQPPPPTINFITNWFEQLRERVPVR